MATHSSILAWEIPWTQEPGKLQSIASQVGHYFVNKGLSSQGYGFSSSHVWMSELDYKEG